MYFKRELTCCMRRQSNYTQSGYETHNKDRVANERNMIATDLL